jgi:hypothetical protein
MDFLKRRSFLKGFGLGGVIVGSAAGGFTAAKAISNTVSQPTHQPAPAVVYPQLEDISHLAPRDTGMDLTLARDNSEPEPPKVTPGSFSIVPVNTKATHQVSMSVGKDNRLWLKVDGKWMRVMVQEDLL